MSFVTPVRPGKPIEGDWVDLPVPANAEFHSTAYVQGAFGFLPYRSERAVGLAMAEGSGAYDFASFIIGPNGRVNVGAFACLNACYLICEERIDIGAHALLGWGSIIMDSWSAARVPATIRRAALDAAAGRPDRWIAPLQPPRPVVLEDNVWVGFESVILPGVRLGRGCIVGSRTVIDKDVPPYAVAAGDPFRIVRWLEPDDSSRS